MDKRVVSVCLNDRSQFSLLDKAPLSAVMSVVQHQHADYEISVLDELLLLDEAYRDYFKDWLKEMELQRMAAGKLLPLTVEFCNRASKYCREPQPTAVDADDIIMTKYQLHYQIIIGSNAALSRGLSAIRINLLAFRREYQNLDLNQETAFIIGDDFHKPITFFFELVDELFKYMFSNHLKLDYAARLLDPADLQSLESYQEMLLPCEEFEEYMLHNLSYCHCLRPPHHCSVKVKSLPRTKENITDAQRRAKMSRCRRRIAKMTKTKDGSVVSDSEFSAIIESGDLEHEFRMNMLSSRLATLRDAGQSSERERRLVQQMIYALSPSLMGPSFNIESFN